MAPILGMFTLDVHAVHLSCRSTLPYPRPTARHSGPPSRPLLLEVKRYPSFVLRTKQLSGEFKRPSGVLAPVYDESWETLVAEPCVAEQELMIRELLEGPFKPRKGIEPR